MKIACLYFPTSSVGGIATNVASLRNEAKRRGDTFHVLVSDNVEKHRFEVFSRPKRIRGGDTYIDVDGYASHHISKAPWVAKQLNANYDLVYLAYLCPHATKAYGDKPVFLELLGQLRKPIIGHITDGYYSTYKAWGDATASQCVRTIVDQPAYVPPGFAEEHDTVVIPFGPFDPVGPGYREPDESRSKGRSMCWIAQWKNIKGVWELFEFLPDFEGEVNLYSNGIEYYYMRDAPEWPLLIGRDHYREKMGQKHIGTGTGVFHGWQPLDVIQRALEYAWFTIEFQGMGNPKFEAYRNGSLNHTIIEALYYGCTPVIPQITIDYAGVPPEAAIGMLKKEDAADILNGDRAPRPDLGRQWVLDRFAVNRIYDQMFGGIL